MTIKPKTIDKIVKIRNKNFGTEKEIKIAKISKIVGVCHGIVTRVLKEHGLSKHDSIISKQLMSPKNIIDEKLIPKNIIYYATKTDKSQKEICDILKVSKQMVISTLQKEGIIARYHSKRHIKDFNEEFFTKINRKAIYALGLCNVITNIYKKINFRSENEKVLDKLNDLLYADFTITKQKDKNSFFFEIPAYRLKNFTKLIGNKKKREREFQLKKILDYKSLDELFDEHEKIKERQLYLYYHINCEIEKNIVNTKMDFINYLYHFYLSHLLRGNFDGIMKEENKKITLKKVNPKFDSKLDDILLRYTGVKIKYTERKRYIDENDVKKVIDFLFIDTKYTLNNGLYIKENWQQFEHFNEILNKTKTIEKIVKPMLI